MMHVVMAAAECAPFAKVGGLGDVIAGLPRALVHYGVRVSIVIPRYRSIDIQQFGFTPLPTHGDARAAVGAERLPYDVYRGRLPGSSIDVFLIGNDRFFGREGIYVDPATGQDYPDQADRWIFFQRAVMEFFKARAAPDILHCHDYQTGLMPAYLQNIYRSHESYSRTRSVFTIHNMGYQGLFPGDVIRRAGFADDRFDSGSPFEFYGMLNFMKSGIAHADLITTVSPTYAREIQESGEYGYGLEGLLREKAGKFIGILNGIDDDLWNPATDPLIPAKYSPADLSGKAENRRALLQKFGIEPSRSDWPVLAMISRIDVQKGFDLLIRVLDDLLQRDLYFVLLGRGHKQTEEEIRSIIQRHPGRAGMRFEFDNGSAHLTEAGADIFLMPSKYEPCGLNQMYSLRYGTPPVVRRTGGLADTVQEFDASTGGGNGFVFERYDAREFGDAITRAVSLWQNKKAWRRLMLNGMNQEMGWRKPAERYVEAYERVWKM